MPDSVTQVNLRRWSIVSARPYASIVAAVEAAIGHPDMRQFSAALAVATSHADVENTVRGAIGRSELMEFMRFDFGALLALAGVTGTPKSIRLVIGNPLIAEQMVRHVPDAASYAPVTVLIDERPDGVHVSYDEMASLLAPYGSPQALQVALDLDAKVKAMLTEAAGLA